MPNACSLQPKTTTSVIPIAAPDEALSGENSSANISQSVGPLPWVERYIQTNWEDPKSLKANGDWNQTALLSSESFPSVGVDESSLVISQTSLADSSSNGTSAAIPASTILSEPRQDSDVATPLTPAKNGHWFPCMSQARMYFDFATPAPPVYLQLYIHLQIQRDQDVYSRYLRVSLDGSQFYETIIGSAGFHGDIPFYSWTGQHTIRLEIYYGGYVQKGWKLLYFWVYGINGMLMDVNGEYTYQSYYCDLKYLAKMGEQTTLNIQVVNAWDTIPRYCVIYVDSVWITTFIVPAAFQIPLGNYADDSIHELMVRIYSCANTEYGKKITQLLVHHIGVKYEMDYQSGHTPDQQFIDYVQAYYKAYCYHRVELYVDQSLIFDDNITGTQCDGMYSVNFQHAGQPYWHWYLFAHYLEPRLGWGFYSPLYQYICIADQSWLDWCGILRPIAWARSAVTMHEHGHWLGLSHYPGGACPCPTCCYSNAWTSVCSTVTYCVYHWRQSAWS